MAALELDDCIDMFNYLLQKGADLNFRIEYSPLMYAIKLNKRADIIRNIIDNGAKLFLHAEDDTSILHIAAMNDNEETIQLLIDKGLNVNTLNRRKETPLHVAARYRNYKTIATLLKNGASINAQDIFGYSPLLISCISNDLTSIKLFIKFKACTTLHNNKQDNMFTLISNPRCYSVFSKEQLRYFIVKYHWITALMLQDNKKLFDHLVKARIITHDTRTVKGIKIADWHYLFIRKYSKVERNVMWKLLHHYNIEQHKLKEYFPPPGNMFIERGISQCIVSAIYGKYSVLKYLYDNGFDFNVSTEKGNTMLHAAIRGGNYAIVKTLIALQHINLLSAKNNALFTPLLTAYYYGHFQIVRLLMKKGAPKPDMELADWIRTHSGKRDSDKIYKIFQDYYVKGVPLNKIEFPDDISKYHGAPVKIEIHPC